MKKRVITLFLALAMVVSLAACGGGGSDVAGTYNLTEMNAGGVSMNIDELSSMAGVDVKITLNLKSDGNFSLDMSAIDASQSLSGTWTADGNTLSITADGATTTGTIDGGTIVLEENGQTMTFEKV